MHHSYRQRFARAIRRSTSVALFAAASLHAAPVVVNGVEWFRPNEVAGHSWNEFAAVCPAGGGVCNGSVGTVDLTGWTWATVQQVGDMLAVLTPHPGGIGYYEQVNSPWAPSTWQFFGPTGWEFLFPQYYLAGWAATSFSDTQAYLSTLVDRIDTRDTDSVSTIFRTTKSSPGGLSFNGLNPYGAWLYRAPSEVPEPGQLALVGIGLALLGLARVAASSTGAQLRRRHDVIDREEP